MSAPCEREIPQNRTTCNGGTFPRSQNAGQKERVARVLPPAVKK